MSPRQRKIFLIGFPLSLGMYFTTAALLPDIDMIRRCILASAFSLLILDYVEFELELRDKKRHKT